MNIDKVSSIQINKNLINKSVQSNQSATSFKGYSRTIACSITAAACITGATIGGIKVSKSQKAGVEEAIKTEVDDSELFIEFNDSTIKSSIENIKRIEKFALSIDREFVSENDALLRQTKNKIIEEELRCNQVQRILVNYHKSYANNCKKIISKAIEANSQSNQEADSIKQFANNIIDICLKESLDKNKDKLGEESKKLAELSRDYSIAKDEKRTAKKKFLETISGKVSDRLKKNFAEEILITSIDLNNKELQKTIKKEIKSLYKELGIYENKEQVDKAYNAFSEVSQSQKQQGCTLAYVFAFCSCLALAALYLSYKFESDNDSGFEYY